MNRTILHLAYSYPNEQTVFEKLVSYVMDTKFPVCPACNNEHRFGRVENRMSFACYSCGHHVYPLAETIFKKSKTPLQTWMYVMWLLAKKDLPVTEIQKKIGVTYKAAWRMKSIIEEL